MEKTCSKCGGELPATTEYWHLNKSRPDGLSYWCKVCQREANRKARSTPEGREASREASRKSRSTPEGREKSRESNRTACRQRYQNGKYQEYIENTPLAKMRQVLSSRVRTAMKLKGWRKNTKTQVLLGCSFEEFKAHIEEQFQPGMSWENAGEWHYDHILPCSCATTEEELIALQHFSNFQPMWGSENISKGATLPPDWRERKQKLMELAACA